MAETMNILLLEDAGAHGAKGEIIVSNVVILNDLNAKNIKYQLGAYEVLRPIAAKIQEKSAEKPASAKTTKTGE